MKKQTAKQTSKEYKDEIQGLKELNADQWAEAIKIKTEAIHYKELCLKLYTALNTVVDRRSVKGFDTCTTMQAKAGDSDLICKALLAYEYNKLK